MNAICATEKVYESPLMDVMTVVSEGVICGSGTGVTVDEWGNGGDCGNHEVRS